MAKADFIKFQELLNSDAEFREKFRTAVGNYTGSPELQEVFEKVILPLGEERGLSATYEEFAGYMKALSEGSQAELSEDELAQVAGGKPDDDEEPARCGVIGSVQPDGDCPFMFGQK